MAEMPDVPTDSEVLLEDLRDRRDKAEKRLERAKAELEDATMIAAACAAAIEQLTPRVEVPKVDTAISHGRPLPYKNSLVGY